MTHPSNILLCVDDSATMQTVAEMTFRNSCREFIGARTVNEARSASGKSPSLILVDTVMPDISGYDLAKELRAANSSAVVVMVSGNTEAYDEDRGAAAGIDGHIIKPWQTDKIVEQLAALQSAGPSTDVPVVAATPPPTPSRTRPPVRSPMFEQAMNTNTRSPMVKQAPARPVRLTLASQAQALAQSKAGVLGLSSEQATAISSVSRGILEQIVWEIVPDLAEAIIRECLAQLPIKTK